MKLTIKMIAIFILGIVIILCFDGYLSMQREVSFFEQDMKKDAAVFGRAIAKPVLHTWERDGLDSALELISEANREDNPVKIRLILLTECEAKLRPIIPQSELTDVAEGREVQVTRERDSRNGLYCSYIPLTQNKQVIGAIEVSESLSYLNEYHDATVTRIQVLTASLVLLGTIYIALFGYLLIGRPLQSLMERVRAISSGEMRQEALVHAKDELGELASALDEMCQHIVRARDELQAESNAHIDALEQLRHTDRLQTVGRLAAGIAHELGTPLNVISGRAGLIAKGSLPPDLIIESSHIIKEQSDRMTGIIRQLLDFARSRTPKRHATELRILIEQTIKLLDPLVRKKKLQLDLTSQLNDLRLMLDTGQIQQVLTNLFVNAFHAVDVGGHITVEYGRKLGRPAGQQSGEDQVYGFIAVNDDGVGIQSDDLRQVFEPFFTTKDVGEGTGLGLSIAYGIIQEHQGWIEAVSEPGHGSQFTIFLPLDEIEDAQT
ncbi:MAG: ATP-binding protein [Planctomycetota bacterium]|nr:ATP-binding protein [Planctomycetota bacterium]